MLQNPGLKTRPHVVDLGAADLSASATHISYVVLGVKGIGLRPDEILHFLHACGLFGLRDERVVAAVFLK